MNEPVWLKAVRRLACELPEDARVVVLHSAEVPSSRERQVVTELATALARHRPPVLLIDLGAEGPDLSIRLAAAGAAGLRDVLRGRAQPIDVAVRVREHGFIYLPPGGTPEPRGPRAPTSGTNAGPGPTSDTTDPATHPRLRDLLARARYGGATTLLYGASDPRNLGDVADGIVWLHSVSARTASERGSPPSPGDGRDPDRPATRPATVGGLPVLVRLRLPAPERRPVSAGRQRRESAAIVLPRAARPRGVRTRREGPRTAHHRSTRHRSTRHRSTRHRSTRHGSMRRVAEGENRAPPIPLLALVLLVSSLAIGLLCSDASEHGGAEPHGEPTLKVSTAPSLADRFFPGDRTTDERATRVTRTASAQESSVRPALFGL